MTSNQRLSPLLFVGSLVSASLLGFGLGIGLSIHAGSLVWQPFAIPVFVTLIVQLVWQQIHIDAEGVQIRFTPFYNRRYNWAEIASVDCVKIDPLTDFGGWGLKYSRRLNAWGYLLGGEDAIRISLTNGKQIYATIVDTQAAQQAVHHFQPLLT